MEIGCVMRLSPIIKELFLEKTRVMLTILAIVWGTFTISSMLSIGEGLRLTFAKAVASSGQNFLSLSGGRTSKKYLGTHPNMPINLDKIDLQAISVLPNIATISPQYDIEANLTYKQKKISGMIKAVDPDYFSIHQIHVGKEGRIINHIDQLKRSAVIVLGSKSQEELFTGETNLVGKMIFVGSQPFTVIGIMQKKPQLISSEVPDEYMNWIPVTTYELLANPNVINSISITYKDLQQLKQTKQQIQKIIALNHNVDPDDYSIINFTDLAKIQKTVNTFFLGMQIFLGIIGFLTLLVAGVGIANVMYASIENTTHEIGIRIALGARTYHILIYYILESLLVTIVGGIVGLLFSWLLIYGINKIQFHGKLIDIIGQPHPVLSLSVIIIVVLVLGLIGFLAGLFPAQKAAKIDPAEALIYE